MNDQRGELLLTPEMNAKNMLAASCRANILRARRNRQAGQYGRRK